MLESTSRALFLSLAIATAGQTVLAAPNIVLVMADDLGWCDTSNALTTSGNPSDFYQTPTLERLATEGVAFTNAYANQNCAPTRAALLTGLYPVRPENNVYQVNNLNRGGKQTMLVGPQQGLTGSDDKLPAESVTVGETLQSAGYRTGYFGKFHVTDSAANIVAEHGFDENFGGGPSGSPGAYHASGGRFGKLIGAELDAFAWPYSRGYIDRNVAPFASGTPSEALDALAGAPKHVTDATIDAAIDFITRHTGGPFFAMVSTHAVHSPIGAAQARPDLLTKYKNLPPGDEDKHASFGALIEGLDQGVGRIVKHLATAPDPARPGRVLAENTVLIFFSDNGGRQHQSNNGPLKGQKGELHEGGVRVPMIAWSGSPRLVRGGRVVDTPVHAIDFHKTFAALADASLEPGAGRDGVDVSPLFVSENKIDRETLFWHLPGYLVDQRDQRPQSVVRRGDFKLIYSYEDQSWRLYDLATDIGEQNDLAASRPELVDELGAELIAWLDEADAPLATLREGRPSLELTIDGRVYADGTSRLLEGEKLVVRPGEEAPLVLGDVRVLAASR